jgi:hypothetical protein
MQLTSDDRGKVTGTATATIEDGTFDYSISGMYNGAALELQFQQVFDESKPYMDEHNFSFSGNCMGDNVFKGPMFLGPYAPEVSLKHLG